MIEYYHIFTAIWEGGRSAIEVGSYLECQELMDLIWMEAKFWSPSPEAGDLLGASCQEVRRVSSAPMPTLRP